MTKNPLINIMTIFISAKAAAGRLLKKYFEIISLKNCLESKFRKFTLQSNQKYHLL